MSCEQLSKVDIFRSVYQHLLNLYEGRDSRNSLDALPNRLREQIFSSICDQNQQTNFGNYGKFHVFDSPKKLQRAISRVAFSAFERLGENEKSKVAWKMSEDPGNDTPLLLEKMEKLLHSQAEDLWEGLVTKEKNTEEKADIANILEVLSLIPEEDRKDVVAQTEHLCKEWGIEPLCNDLGGGYSHKISYTLKKVHAIPKKDREDVIRQTTKLYKALEIRIGIYIFSIHKRLIPILKEERGDVIRQTVTFFKECSIAKNGFNVSHILTLLSAITKEERERIAKQTATLCKTCNIASATSIYDILRKLSDIPKEEVEDFITQAEALFKALEITKFSYDSRILETLAAIPKEERGGVVAQTMSLRKAWNIPNVSGTCNILEVFLTIPKERKEAAKQASDLFKQCRMTDYRKGALILGSLGLFPKDLREEVANIIKSILKLQSEGLPEPRHNTRQLIKLILQKSPHLAEPLHKHLLECLDSEHDSSVAGLLATTIWENQSEFFLHGDHPLTEKALQIISLTNSPKNPYTIYKKCKNPDEKGILQFETPYELIDGQSVALNRTIFEIRSRNRVTFSMLPTGITDQTMKEVFGSLEHRVKELDDAHANEVMAYIESAFNASFSFLKANMTSDAYLIKLLSQQGLPNDQAPLQKVYLISLLKYAQNLPNERQKAGDLLSPREQFILSLSDSIQGCKAGKAESLAVAYNHFLPDANKLSYIEEAGHPDVENALAQLDNVILQFLTDSCSSENSMMRELTGEYRGPIRQFGHQSLYLKNMVAPLIGLPHTLQFDLHTETLYDVLVQRSRLDLLAIFYKHVTPQALLNILVNKATKDSGLFYPLIRALLEQWLPEIDFSTVWDLDEDGKPILTQNGALQICQAAGFIRKKELSF